MLTIMENPCITANEGHFLTFSVLTVPISQGLSARCLGSQSAKIIQQLYNCLLLFPYLFSGGAADRRARPCTHWSQTSMQGDTIFLSHANTCKK